MTKYTNYAKILLIKYKAGSRNLSTNLALSTTWMRNRFSTLREFFSAAEAIGVERFELDASISLKDISNISLPEGQIPSLEVPCPANPKNFDARFSSLDHYERDGAHEAAQDSFELAFDVKAEVLIINMGRVDISPKLEDVLRETWQKGGSESTTFQDLQKELINLRASRAEPHLEAALYDVEYLANQATKFGLKLGLVTPQAYSDFPLPEEMDVLLEEFGDPVYYWHDVGQAQIFHTLNLLPQNIWLDMFVEKTIGVHLHQTVGLDKGRPPTPETIAAFENIVTTIPKDVLLTCKFSSIHPPEVIKEGINLLQRAFSPA